MKFTSIVLSIAFVGMMTAALAYDNAQTTVNVDIDAQIEKIKAAPLKERVRMMNELKQKLSEMNRKQRMTVIAKMQEKMHGQAHIKTGVGMMEKDRNNHQMKYRGEITQEHQMQTNEQMNHMQNMNHEKVGNWFNQMHQTDWQSQGSGISGGNINGENMPGNISGVDNSGRNH